MTMPGMRSITGIRLVAAAILVIFASQMLVLVFLFQAQNKTARDFLLPLPSRVASIVEIVEATGEEDRAVLLESLNTSQLRIAMVDAFDPADAASETIRLRALRRSLSRYGEALEGRRMFAMVDGDAGSFGSPVETEIGLRADYPMRLVIELGSGEWLAIETPSLFEIRFRNLPVGVGAGIFGLIVASLALFSIWQQFRPVRDMAKAARSFSETGKSSPVKPGGSRDVRDLAQAFNDMQTRIEALLANRTLMMSAMSHDVRTYLTRLRLRVEMLDEKNRDAAEATIEEIQALLNDTLAFAEAAEGAETGEEADIAHVLSELMTSGQFSDQVCWANQSAFQRKRIFVAGRADRLQRALVNLITNAEKYGEAVELTLRTPDRAVILEIADHGPGIPDAEKKLVLEPFYRRDASRNRHTEGAGLGLAIAHTIIERAGGTLALADRPGGGLIARVTLKRAI
ncbi:ATP-binding protein [Ponticaulis profundi]|uniref:histidine kinase n=1 Tax=Ponticaulis profundi TaxID=2665222 RepID=A0ABW1S9P8_9PROT